MPPFACPLDLSHLTPPSSLDRHRFLALSHSRESPPPLNDPPHTPRSHHRNADQCPSNPPDSFKITSCPATPPESPAPLVPLLRPYLDVTLYVGKNRTPYVHSIESLKNSAYFRSILERRSLDSPSRVSPIFVDCEEPIFQQIMTVLRYGSFEALPKLSDVEMFRLKKELEFYGIQWVESPKKRALIGRSGSCASSPLAMSPASSPSAVSPVHNSHSVPNSHFSLAELPDFPTDLVDPAKLVLVSRLDDDKRGSCPCVVDDKPSEWALNFHYRHAFCTACGRSPTKLVPKFLAEMFMAAASYHCGSERINPKKWSVGCDSTCTLKFLSTKVSCSCSGSKQTTWAVNTYHSHAFCTRCGECAEGSALVCILLTLRYGGGHHHRSPKGRRDPNEELPTATEIMPVMRPASSKAKAYGFQSEFQFAQICN